MANDLRERVTVVAVLTDDQDRNSLRGIFAHSNWGLRFVPTLGAADRLLRQTTAGILIASEALPEGDSWREALRRTQQMESRPLLIVASRLADEGLWAEVLNIGAYDVLATPFDPREVYRVISFAWQTWRRKKELGGSVRREYASVAAAV